MRRVLDVARIQTVNWMTIFGWPLVILAVVMAFNILVFGALVNDVPPDSRVTGALISIYIVMLVTHVQTMTQVFPLALGMSVTRRTFYAGTGLLVLVQSVFFATVLLVLHAIETATDGWGVGIRFTALPFLPANPFQLWLAYLVPFLALSAAGVFGGVVFKRWGAAGVYTLGIGSTVVVGGLILLITYQGWWPAVGSFFVDQSTFALLTLYPALLALVLGAAGWLALRRATP